MSIQDAIREQVTTNPVVLYMKGTAQFPQCGFSSTAVQILNACGVKEYITVNVLADEAIRQGIKEFANWPTIPQLYVNGEFVGGSDILYEMYQSGELQKVLPQQAAACVGRSSRAAPGGGDHRRKRCSARREAARVAARTADRDAPRRIRGGLADHRA